MKSWMAILLLSVFGTVMFRPLLPWAAFKLNQAQLAKEVCRERDQKVNHCQGHCYLQQQLERQQEDQSSQDVPLLTEAESMVYLCGSVVIVRESESMPIHHEMRPYALPLDQYSWLPPVPPPRLKLV